MKKDKLLRLAQILREKAAEWGDDVGDYFDMEVWGRKPRNRCGFAGCAIGTLCYYYPEETNLKLHPSIYYPILVLGDDSIYNEDRDLGDVWAIAMEFDIGVEDARNLFLNSSYDNSTYVHPLTVAERIEEFVAAN